MENGNKNKTDDLQKELIKEEPWLPIETKLISWSFIWGLVFLVVLAVVVNMLIL